MANIHPLEAIHFSQSILNKLFKYKNGKLFWKINVGYKIRAGSRAGSLSHTGYRRVCFNKQSVSEHRVIWIMHYGEIPLGYEIDHIDNNKSNNFLSNMRLATRSQNAHWIQCGKSTSGYKGVTEVKCWKASISVNGKLIHLGYYSSPELAHEAYKNAAIKYFGEFANFQVNYGNNKKAPTA